MTALVDANTSERTPAARAASSTACVPATLVSNVPTGFSTERSTDVTAARCTTESNSSRERRVEDVRVGDVADHDVDGRIGVGLQVDHANDRAGPRQLRHRVAADEP